MNVYADIVGIDACMDKNTPSENHLLVDMVTEGVLKGFSISPLKLKSITNVSGIKESKSIIKDLSSRVKTKSRVCSLSLDIPEVFKCQLCNLISISRLHFKNFYATACFPEELLGNLQMELVDTWNDWSLFNVLSDFIFYKDTLVLVTDKGTLFLLGKDSVGVSSFQDCSTDGIGKAYVRFNTGLWYKFESIWGHYFCTCRQL